LLSTEELAHEVVGGQAPSGPGRRHEGGLDTERGSDSESGAATDSSLAPAPSPKRLEEEKPDAGAAAEASDPYRTVSSATIEPLALSGSRKPVPPDWPIVPGYEILQRLGEGGMGVVSKARHAGPNRLVALKMIRGGFEARVNLLSRFRIEAEAVARLRHPNILQIYDIGEAAGLPFVGPVARSGIIVPY
jgi:serine/threonine protein kinase